MGSVIDCRVRTVVLEHAAESTVDSWTVDSPEFDRTYRKIEMMLAARPDEVGIRGVVCASLGIGLYLHISGRFPPIEVLYRYNHEKVYIESIAVGIQASSSRLKDYVAS